MEYNFVSIEEYKALKKKRTLLLCLCIAIAVVFGILCLCSGLFQNRDTGLYWIIGGSIATFLFLFAESYILLVPFGSLISHISFFDKALSKPRIRNKVTVVGVKKESETYLGMETYSIEVFENDEKEVWRIRYFVGSGFEPEIDKSYVVETYDEVLLRVESL